MPVSSNVPTKVEFYELVGSHDAPFDKAFFSDNTWKSRFTLLSIQAVHPEFSFSTVYMTWPEIRSELEEKSGIQRVTVPALSVEPIEGLDVEALARAGWTEKGGRWWICDSEKIAAWADEVYGLPDSLRRTSESMTESQASDMWALLRPAFGAFLPEGSEAKRYLMTLKYGSPQAWNDAVARAFQPETHAKAVEAFEAVEARLASEPYLGGSTPSFEDYSLFGIYASFATFAAYKAANAEALSAEFWTGGKYPALLEWKNRMGSGWGGEPGRIIAEGGPTADGA